MSTAGCPLTRSRASLTARAIVAGPASEADETADEPAAAGDAVDTATTAAGLAALRGRTDAAYLSSCDVPFLQPAFVRRLIDLLGDYHICVPRVGDYHHTLAAVYRLNVADAVSRLAPYSLSRPFAARNRWR